MKRGTIVLISAVILIGVIMFFMSKNKKTDSQSGGSDENMLDDGQLGQI